MRLILLCFFVFSINFNSNCQSTFQTAYGNNDIADAKAIVKDSNYYYVVGQMINAINFDTDISFFCIDDDGGLLWSVTLGTNKNDYVKSLVRTSDGGFAICGETYGGLIDSLTSDLFLIKTDAQGFPIFAETYGGPGSETAGGLLEDMNGNFYISGSTTSYGNALESALITKTDASGNILWTNVNNAYESNRLNGICQLQNGDLISTGYTFHTVNPFHNNYIVGLDTNGNVLNQIRTGTLNFCSIAHVTATSDGGFATCGLEYLNAGTYYMNVCKYDSSGTRAWNKNFGTGQDEAFAIIEANNGDLIVSGKSNISLGGNPDYKSSVLRLDNLGNLIIAKTYGYNATTCESNSLVSGFNNSIVSAGKINDPGIGSNVQIVKMDASGNSGCFENNYSPSASNITFVDSSNVESQQVSMMQFLFNPLWQSLINQFTLYCFTNSTTEISGSSPIVFPNPGTGKFRIETGNLSHHHIEIYDAIGQKFMQNDFGQGFVDVDLTNYLPGIYYYKIDNSLTGKIILTGN